MQEKLRDSIIHFIKENKISTAEISDVLGKKGVLPNIFPINRGIYAVGSIQWVYAYAESNYSMHKQIQDCKKDSVVFIEAFECEDRAIFGELVSQYILLHSQSCAIITNGKVRDSSALISKNFPIWCSGFTPVGCFNHKPKKTFNKALKKKHFNIYNNSIAVCDDCGVVVIPKKRLTQQFFKALQQIKEQEKLWFDRLLKHKENTFEIVCEKRYLDKNSDKF